MTKSKTAAFLILGIAFIAVVVFLVMSVDARGSSDEVPRELTEKLDLQQEVEQILRNSNTVQKEQLSETMSDWDELDADISRLINDVENVTEELTVLESERSARNQDLENLSGQVTTLNQFQGERDQLAKKLADQKAAAKKAADEEAARKAAEEAKKITPPSLVRPGNCPSGLSFLGNVSGYSSTPDQTWGDPYATATGTRVHWGTVAVDPNHIPYGCRLTIEGFPGTVFTAEDTGGAILGYWNRVDIWFPDTVESTGREKALDWGRRWVTVTIL